MSRKTTFNRVTSPTVPINYKPNSLDLDKLKTNAGFNLPNTKMEGSMYPCPRPRVGGMVGSGARHKKT